MAIVKFVSDKDCQVFIDMEFAGKVAPDSMLKVTLETGGYLIQIKDDDGHLIKEYDLEIKVSDNQVLQKINESNCQIEDVIGELRNDSSLRFYHQRAIFCYNGNYGYINNQYKIAIEPIFSYAENFTNGLALVKKIFPNGEKATVIDVDGNISLDRWYDYIGGNEKTVLLKSEKIFYVLSKVDYSIVNQYLDAKYDGKGELIPVHKHIGVDDMYGFIDKAGTEIIPLIYDYAGNFKSNNLATVKRFGEYNSVDLDGNLYRYGIHSYKKVMEIRKKIMDNEPFDTDSYNKEFISKEDSLYRGFDKYPMKEQNGWKIRINETDEEICDHVFDDWFKIGDQDQYMVLFRKDRVCKLISKEYDYWRRPIWDPRCETKVLLSIEADAIIPAFSWFGRPTSEYFYLNYIIIRRNWKYGIVDIEKNSILPIDYDFIEPTDAYNSNYSEDIAIVWKGEKCSLFSMEEREFIVPFEFDDIVVNGYYDDCGNIMDDCTFSMKKNGKYGLIANDYKTAILPYEYDTIKLEFDCWCNKGEFYSCERMILSKDIKYGMWQRLKYRTKDTESQLRKLDIRIDEKYDECVFLNDKNSKNSKAEVLDVAVRMANKWAVINCSKGKVDVKNLLFKYDSLDEINKARQGIIVKMTVPPKSPSKGIKY